MSTSKRTRPSDPVDQKIAEYARVAVPVATIVVATAVGSVFGVPVAILILAGGALIGVIVIFWASVRTLFGETRLAGADAYALGAPRAEEEQKRAVLRALKDLEFERSVGKISEQDYQALTAKYRAEAKRLLRVLDEGAVPHREHVEGLIAKRLRREGLIDDDDDAPADTPAGHSSDDEPLERKKKGKKTTRPAEHEPDKRLCPACRTPNDVDAVFCKKCGSRQSSDPEPVDDELEAQHADREAEV